MNQVVHDLINFNTACDEFVNGKYILAEVKISSLLNIIAEDDKLRNIVASTLENYDFKENLIKATKSEGNGYSLTLPTDEKEIIAFVYGLFYRFNNKTIDFYDFISQYYKSDDENPGKEFYNFALAIITPFKDAINSIYSKRHVIVESDDYQKNYYNKIITAVKLIVKNLDNYKLKMNEKEEFTMLLNSLYLASQKNDKKLVFSLMVGLDYFSRCNKRTRNAYLTLEECFTN